MSAFLFTQFLTAGALWLLAVWLLLHRGRGTRLFALYLFVQGAITFSNRFSEVTTSPVWADAWANMAQYFHLASPFALAAFAAAYGLRRGRLAVLAGIVLLAALVLGAYAVDHCLVECGGEPGQSGTLGILNPVSSLTSLGAALVAVWFARRATTDRDDGERGGHWWVAAALSMESMLFGAIPAGLFIANGWEGTVTGFEPSSIYAAGLLILLAAWPLALTGLLVLLRPALEDASQRPRAWRIGIVAVLVMLSGVFVGLDVFQNELPLLFIVGFWRFLMPAFVAYALVRHRVFGLEAKAKIVINRGTVVGVIAAVAFLVSEFVEQQFGVNQTGPAIAAAALISIAFRPLTWLGHRVAERIIPDIPTPLSLGADARLNLYRHQAELVFEDGRVTTKERHVLDRLREHLDLSAGAARRIEHEAKGARKP